MPLETKITRPAARPAPKPEEKTNRFGITFGAIAFPLKRQLRGLRIKGALLDSFQEDADAITRLYLRGILSPGMVKLARNRLGGKIFDTIGTMRAKRQNRKEARNG